MPARFFIPQKQLKNNQAQITGKDQHHLIDVLRHKIGDEIEIIDGQSNIYAAKIEKITAQAVTCLITAKKSRKTELPIPVTIFQCLPKAKKMDWIIEKCTELGVFKIVPVISERSIPKLDSAGQKHKLFRWEQIAKSAAEQCGRAILPKLGPVQNFAEAVKVAADLKIIPWESEKTFSLKAALQNKGKVLSLAVYIGPEGGFSLSEIETAKKETILPVTLGPRVLRTETVGIFVLSALAYEYEL
ncbi:MAG: 16S rRNA (uracil(1498)-N(3))-methyltransferase [Candidatus Margulisiibacteriota bacterium]